MKRIILWTGGVVAALLLVAAAGLAMLDVPPVVIVRGCDEVAPVAGDLAGAESHTYRQAAGDSDTGRDLRIHVIRPRPEKANGAAIALFFGGGWRIGQPGVFAERAQAFADAGYVALLPDYRVSCRDRTNVADSLADAEAALAWIRANAGMLQIDPGRIALGGGSAGGYLALAAAMRAPAAAKPAALVLYNPVTDLRPHAFWLGLDGAEAAALSPATLPVSELPPAIIFHGTADETVPIAEIRSFRDRAVAQGRIVRLVAYDGRDHGFFRDHGLDPALGISPYTHTLARSKAFLNGQGLQIGW